MGKIPDMRQSKYLDENFEKIEKFKFGRTV